LTRLIDEVRLLVHPVLLAKRRPEFTHLTERVELTFKSLRTFQSGLVMLIYDVRARSRMPLSTTWSFRRWPTEVAENDR
jgi:hypothetical protein